MADLNDSFYHHLCRDAGLALVAADTQLRIRFWNAAAGRIFGGSQESMLGQPLSSAVPAERRQIAQRLFERTLRQGEISEFDFSHRSPSGAPMSLAVTISPVIDETGTTLGISVYLRDVTRRMELERQSANAQKMTALGAMAGGIAHHFNNVVGGVITTIDFAQTSDDPQFVRRLLGSAVTALIRASRLTQALLVFAEGDRTDTIPADLVQTVSETLKPLTLLLNRQNIQLQAHFDPIRAAYPLKRIQTILDRLTSNAIEAMPEGGTLQVDVRGQDKNVVLIVKDTGVGIESENLSRLFEPFFTTKFAESTDTTQHSGLGLAVVHGVVRDLGGTIAITSEPGAGTTCTVQLPLPAAESPEE